MYAVAQDFGWALRQLRCGKRVARQGWNGKGMWLILIPGTLSVELMKGTAYHKALNRETCNILPHIDMHTEQGDMLPGWLASQTDMLAEDWMLVE